MEAAQSSTNAVSNPRQQLLLSTKLHVPLVTDTLISRPRLIVAGLSNQQITQQLVVENNTLKTHIKHLYRKLHVSSRSRAIARARELNLI